MQIQKLYRSYVQISIAIQLPTYSTGRPLTMMEVDCWPPKPSEWDPLALFLSPIALTMTPTGERVQTWVQHRPSMLKTTSTMTKWASTQKSHKAITLKVARTSTTRSYVMKQAPYQVQPLKDHPDKPIPPKPSYLDCPTSKTVVCSNNASLPHVFGHKNKEQLSFSPNPQLPPPMFNRQSTNSTSMTTQCSTMMTTTDPKWCEAISPDVKVAEQWQQWEHLHEFHASIQLWPADISLHEIAGGSPLMRVMVYPPPTTTWLSTYSWTRLGLQCQGLTTSTTTRQ